MSIKKKIILLFQEWKMAILQTYLGRKIYIYCRNEWTFDAFSALIGMIIFACTITAFYFALYLFMLIFSIIFYEVAKLNIDSDSWMNFTGSLLGGVITMLGVIFTIRYERKHDEKNKAAQVQPIIIMSNPQDIDIIRHNNVLVQSIPGDNSNSMALRISDLLIENLGNNVALDVELEFTDFPLIIRSTSYVDKLYPKTKKKIGIFVYLDIDKVLEDMKQLKGKSDLAMDKIYIRNFVNDEVYDFIEVIASYDFILVLTYLDLYKNKYEQVFNTKLYIFKVKEEFNACFLSNHIHFQPPHMIS